MTNKNTPDKSNRREIRPNPKPGNKVRVTYSYNNIDHLKSRVYDILNHQKQGIKELYIEHYGINFLYKIEKESLWKVEDIVILGMEYDDVSSFDPHSLRNKDIISVQVLDPEFIDYCKNHLHVLICEKEELDPINMWMLFENKKWEFTRLHIPVNYELITTNASQNTKEIHVIEWEKDNFIEELDSDNQVFYIDKSDPNVYLLGREMSVYKNHMCIENFSSQHMKVCRFENSQYVYALRETTLLFYWEVIDKTDDTYSLDIFKNYEIAGFWKQLTDTILKWEGLENVNMEVLFKRWGSSDFVHVESWMYDGSRGIDPLGDFLWLSTNKTTLD